MRPVFQDGWRAASPSLLSTRRDAIISLLGGAVTLIGPNCLTRPVHAETHAPPPRRIVTIGADITETVAELDGLERIVGCDRSSRRPQGLRERATLGYFRAISTEGLLSLRPDLVISTPHLGPDGVREQLQTAGVALAFVEAPATLDGIRSKVDHVAQLIGQSERAAVLNSRIADTAADLTRRLARSQRRPRVLFVLSADSGSVMAAGDIETISAALTMAGLENAGRSWKNIKPVSREAFIASPPDGMVTTPDLLAKHGGAAGLLKVSGFETLLQPGAVMAIDAGPFMLFGPSTPSIARDVAAHFMPDLFKDTRG